MDPGPLTNGEHTPRRQSTQDRSTRRAPVDAVLVRAQLRVGDQAGEARKSTVFSPFEGEQGMGPAATDVR